MSIFGYSRRKFDCDKLYCHFSSPEKFMKEIDMHHGNIPQAVVFLIGIFLLFHLTAFLIMKLRLKNSR